MDYNNTLITKLNRLQKYVDYKIKWTVKICELLEVFLSDDHAERRPACKFPTPSQECEVTLQIIFNFF